jgi:hypothetical protein
LSSSSSFSFFFIFLFWREAYCVAQAGLTLMWSSCLRLTVLGLYPCTTMPCVYSS